MKNRRFFLIFIFLTIIVLLDVSLMLHCKNIAKLNSLLAEDTIDTLRAQEIQPKLLKQFREWEKEEKEKEDKYSCYDYLCAWFLTGETGQDSLKWYIDRLRQYDETAFQEFTSYLQAVWEDLTYFPIPESLVNEDATVSFGDSWMTLRTFGGERGHEGTDIMAAINQRGRYPVISMTDGVVEKIGWLTQGGYRLGIRAPHGGYFYYAHLSDYAKDFQAGDEIQAGDLLGFMGDSGYSEVEGTVGNFDVHLHLGIYVNRPDGTEISINSYWPLKYIEMNKLAYKFY